MTDKYCNFTQLIHSFNLCRQLFIISIWLQCISWFRPTLTDFLFKEPHKQALGGTAIIQLLFHFILVTYENMKLYSFRLENFLIILEIVVLIITVTGKLTIFFFFFFFFFSDCGLRRLDWLLDFLKETFYSNESNFSSRILKHIQDWYNILTDFLWWMSRNPAGTSFLKFNMTFFLIYFLSIE